MFVRRVGYHFSHPAFTNKTDVIIFTYVVEHWKSIDSWLIQTKENILDVLLKKNLTSLQ